MKRIWTTSLAVSLLVLPACKGGASADAVKLVPDEAEFIVGMNPKTITGSELYKEFSSEFEKEDDYKKAMSAFEDCKLKPTEFDAIVVGANQAEEFVAVIVGEGIGDEENALCVAKKMNEKSGEEGTPEVTKEDGKSAIALPDSKGHAYLVNKNMMAIVSTGWESKVGELIDGKGTPAIENSKKDLFGGVDSKAAMWFIADVPSELAGMAAMAAPEATEVKTVSGSVDLSKGIAVNFVAGFADADKAKATADKLLELFDKVKGDAPPELSGVVESVKIEASGTDVKLGVSASMDDIKAGKDKIPM